MSEQKGDITEHLIKGILIGGSIGLLAHLIVGLDIRRAISLGILCGLMAGVTMAKITGKRG